MSEIAERLRRGDVCDQSDGKRCRAMDARSGCDCAEAADEIDRLTARVAKLEKTALGSKRTMDRKKTTRTPLAAGIAAMLAEWSIVTGKGAGKTLAGMHGRGSLHRCWL